jgi:YidC/Oxa1 family membrane protein insertase
MYRSVSHMEYTSRFLWIPSLAKPDLWLTALVTALMVLTMAAAPGATNSANGTALLFMLLPVLVSVAAIAAMPSAIGVYWATSNAVTLGQTVAISWIGAPHRRKTP